MGLSRGGMGLKLTSAQTAAVNGVPVVIADGRKARVLNRIVCEASDSGTLIGSVARQQKNLSSRKRWIAFFHRAEGTLTVDDGAASCSPE